MNQKIDNVSHFVIKTDSPNLLFTIPSEEDEESTGEDQSEDHTRNDDVPATCNGESIRHGSPVHEHWHTHRAGV